jgi:predicted DNA-binding protein (MmcQ/YjbR family)
MRLAEIRKRLRAAALAYPGAVEEFPWGERVVKVGGRVFVFLGADGDELSVSAKLPHSGALALALPFAAPTGYGLGRSGWVTASFTRAADVPVDLVLSWIDESYRARAPRKLIAKLDAGTPAAPTQSVTRRKK